MISFDVFDTLITRRTATPQGILFLMQDILQTNSVYPSVNEYVRLNFCRLRKIAEDVVRANNSFLGKEDVTLRQIYSGMKMCGCIGDEETEALYGLECGLELESVLPVGKNIRKAKEYADQGEHVILISDMYLEKEVIAAMLERADPFLATLPLYVSSAYGKTKWSGQLYSAVAREENVPFAAWEHFGDNRQSDVEVPRRLGIRAHHLEAEALTGCEEYLLRNNGKDSSVQLQIGAARYARLSNDFDVSGKIGCSFGGEILLSYVLWILRQCEERHIRRLYFVARDGYLLKKIADAIIENRNLDVTTAYLYGSRKAWRVPAMACGQYEWDLVEFIRWSHIEKIKTTADLAEIFELPEEKFIPYMPVYYRENKSHLLNSYELKLLIIQLQQNESFKECFRNFHMDRRERVKKYLKENIDASDDRFAFVEVGGSGLTQEYLAILLQDTGRKKIKTFYFKFDRVIQSGRCDFYVFLPSLFKTDRLIEMVCRAPHEQTVDYTEQNGKMIPVFQGSETEALLEHGFLKFEEGVMKLVNAYLKNVGRPDSAAGRNLENTMAISMDLMKYAGEQPDRELLDYLGDMPTSETGRNNVVKEVFAPRLSKQDIRNIYWKANGGNAEQYYKGSSIEYSILRCSPGEKRFLEKVKKRREKANQYGFFRNRHGKNVKKTAEEIAEYFVRSLSGRISVYGAGKYGKLLVDAMKKNADIQLAHWWDRNAEKLKEQGYPVESCPDKVEDQCGIIIIAIMDKKTVFEITEQLKQWGAAPEKIIFLDLNYINGSGTRFWEYERLFVNTSPQS